MTKRWTLQAGALTALICFFGSTASVAAAGSAGGHSRADSSSVAPEQAGPDYEGRQPGDHPKLDKTLNERSTGGGLAKSRVIVMLQPGCSVDQDLARFGGKKGRSFGVIRGHVAEVPNFVLRKLAENPCVTAIHHDRGLGGEMNYAAVVEGARTVQARYGLDGAGVGVAVIDSGVAWHDDLTYQGANGTVQVNNGQRVAAFVDFVNGRTTPYDDYGHGTHVAGIIAGNGYDSSGARAGIAPAADIVSLKVLDGNGGGYISNVIAALDWVVANHAQYNIRVVNLSVGAAVTESYMTDPLALAAKRVVDTGVVVVTSAGNLGKNSVTGKVQYGAITAPGNSPWVLTVGAYSHMGTITRSDDKMADFSSRGPTAHNYLAKPDVVATGVGISSLSVPGSTLYNNYPALLIGGAAGVVGKPYLSLSGTSMAAPIVTGTVALMIQANPNLTPNLAKAIIEYTAQNYGYDSLTQGAGFLNTKGAVDLSRFLSHPTAGQRYPSSHAWSKTILWGNRKVKRGVIKPAGNAWATSTVWGSKGDIAGSNIVWGTVCGDADCDNIVWGTSALDVDNIVWGTVSLPADNVVWGTSLSTLDNIVWGTACDFGCDNIVWGTTCGGADCDNIVWGTNVATGGLTNVVWGTADLSLDNIVWGTSLTGDVANIVWGTADLSLNNIVWGTASADGVTFVDPLTPVDASTFELDPLYVVSPDPVPAPAAPAPAPTNPAPTPPIIDPTVTATATTTTVATPTTTTTTTTTTAAPTTTTAAPTTTTTTIATTTTAATPVATTAVVGGL